MSKKIDFLVSFSQKLFVRQINQFFSGLNYNTVLKNKNLGGTQTTGKLYSFPKFEGQHTYLQLGFMT